MPPTLLGYAFKGVPLPRNRSAQCKCCMLVIAAKSVVIISDEGKASYRGDKGVGGVAFSEKPEHRWRKRSEVRLLKGLGVQLQLGSMSPHCPRGAESSSAAHWNTDLACFNT